MSALMNDWIGRHQINVDEYHRMADTGIISPDARVELIEGEIIDMDDTGPSHGGTTDQLYEILFQAIAGRAHIRCQAPLLLSNLSEPQPDFVVARRRADFYKWRPLGPVDTFLVIEVSNTRLRFDTQVKAPLYARHGIPEMWIVDLTGREVRFHRSPRDGRYSDVTSTSTPGTVVLGALPEVHIDLSHIFDE